MAKTKTAVSAEILRPYVQRALTDPDFRADMLAAVAAARGLYGQIATKPGVKGKAKGVSDQDFQAQLRELVSELSVAGDRIKGKAPKKAKSHKKRNRILLLAGMVLGLLYNPWTGQQTRDWISSQVAGGDDEFETIPDEAPIVESVATTNGGPDSAEDE